MLTRILIIVCLLPILAVAQGLPYVALKTLQDHLQELRKTDVVTAELILRHSDPKDDRDFRLFLETPGDRTEIEVHKDGSFRLPQLSKEEAERGRVVHSLEKNALTLSFGFGFRGGLPQDEAHEKTLFELCSLIGSKVGRLNHLWTTLGEAFHDPELKNLQIAIVGVSCRRERPYSGQILLQKGDKTVASIDLSQPGTDVWFFDQYDPKAHRIVWETEEGEPAPEMFLIWKHGKEIERVEGAIFVRKVEQ